MQRIKVFILTLFVLLTGVAFADDYPIGWIPEKSNTIVNDLCGILTEQERNDMEHLLVAFDDSTSNQIMVLITPSLGGDEIASFTQNVWAKWKVGNSKFNNGVIIVVKPKIGDEYGECRIQTGYGLEGALPDLFCSNIIERDMIPHFREDDYYGGIMAAIEVIKSVCVGEYSYDRRKAELKSEAKAAMTTILLFVVLFIVAIYIVYKDSKKHPERYQTTFPPTGPYIGSSYGRSSGSWNSFSGGSSSFGGFGGFGGGLSGGGGASGRW